MRFVDNQEITDPRTNIALETYLVENRLSDEPLLLFYINEPSIIIGRNQNTVEEVNQAYVDAHGFMWCGGCLVVARFIMIWAIFLFVLFRMRTVFRAIFLCLPSPSLRLCIKWGLPGQSSKDAMIC